MEIMHTGSSTLAMILVKHVLGFVLLQTMVTALSSCSEHILFLDDSSHQAAMLCGDLCEEHELTIYQGENIHVEVEPFIGLAQVFHNVSPAQLRTGLSLKNNVTVIGEAQGASAFLKLDTKNNRESPSLFSDIIAIPIANKTNYLSPTIPSQKAKLQSDQSYAINLQSGLEYAIILNPNGLYNHAPIFIKPGIIIENKQLNFNVNQKPIKLTAKIASSDTNILAVAEIPQIQARLMQGNRLVSSVENIKKDGTICLEVANNFFLDINDLPLWLIIEPQDQENALPRLKIKVEKNLAHADISMGTIDLGSLKTPFSRTFTVKGNDKSIIPNATIFMRANVGTGTSFVKKQVNSEGTAQFNQLYSGDYDIAVIPPFDSPFAMKLLRNIHLENGENKDITIELSLRKLFHGKLVDDNNRPISGAQIELSRIGKIGDFATEDIFDDMLFKLTTTTDESGRICQRRFGFETSNPDECSPLTLDGGRFLAHVIPPPGSKLAHHWLTFDFPNTQSLEIKLETPLVIIGRIFGPDGHTPEKNAYVTVYLNDTLPNQSIVVANAITDEFGNFRAFITKK